jgi:hypothetical protein
MSNTPEAAFQRYLRPFRPFSQGFIIEWLSSGIAGSVRSVAIPWCGKSFPKEQQY